MSNCLVYVGVADATRMHLHQHLTRSRLWPRNILNLPGTADGGHDCGFHTFPPLGSFVVLSENIAWSHPMHEVPVDCLAECSSPRSSSLRIWSRLRLASGRVCSSKQTSCWLTCS